MRAFIILAIGVVSAGFLFIYRGMQKQIAHLTPDGNYSISSEALEERDALLLTSKLVLGCYILAMIVLAAGFYAASVALEKRRPRYQVAASSERALFDRLFYRRTALGAFQFTILELFAAAVAVQLVVAAFFI